MGTLSATATLCLPQDYSSNGTFVNDYKVGKGNKVELSDGDVISFLKPWDPQKDKPPYAFEVGVAE